MTTKYLVKFQSSSAITRPNIIGPERIVNLICNSSLYTHIPNIKSISQSIAKKSGRNCFISELRTWVTLYVPATINSQYPNIIKWIWYWYLFWNPCKACSLIIHSLYQIWSSFVFFMILYTIKYSMTADTN